MIRQRLTLTALSFSWILILILSLTEGSGAWLRPGDRRGPRFTPAPAASRTAALPWDDGATRGTPVVLQWDQLGATSIGVGTSGTPAAQALMLFGGGSVTTGLAPLIQPVAASWSIFTCTMSPCPPRVPANYKMDTQRVNLWNTAFNPALGRREPGARIFNTVFRSPANPPGTAVTVNEFVIKTFTGAPVFRPSEFFFAGIGASGPNNPSQFWNFVAEPVNPDAHRQWFGGGATTAATVGPTTFASQFYAVDFGIRVTVDPGVPPELDVGTGPAASGASRLRTFRGP